VVVGRLLRYLCVPSLAAFYDGRGLVAAEVGMWRTSHDTRRRGPGRFGLVLPGGVGVRRRVA